MSATVGLVVVSHSRALARAAVALAQEMLHGDEIHILIAAGLDDTTFGTDAAQIVDAVTAADHGAGVVVLMDVGSAVLSAELALELLDDDTRDRVVLCPAPLVEGLIVAAVAAAGGAGIKEVAAEATAALGGKIGLLGPAPTTAGPDGPRDEDLTGSFVVTNPHGLHARPAARLVQEVRRHEAHALIRNRTSASGWVDAHSLSRIATLGVRASDEVEVRISGSQAAETLEGILALAARHFDEPLTATAPAPPEAPSHPIGASPGLGIGPARSARLAPIAIQDVPAEGPALEWRRLGNAIAVVRRTITQLRTRIARELGEAQASIFDAHQLLLDDSALLDDVRARIDNGLSAVAAWSAGVRDLAAAFAALPDPYVRARAHDVAAVGDQVLRAMLPGSAPAETATGVLIAADLTPAQAVELDPAWVAAVLLSFGSPHAHNMILLRAKGIPAVVGAGTAVLSIPEGTTVAVDGTRGEFFVDPPDDFQRDFRARLRRPAGGYPRWRDDSRRRQHRLRRRRPSGRDVRRGFRGTGAHRVSVPRPSGGTRCRGATGCLPQDW
jgi:multiphosphoryl transfer protein